MKAQKIKLTADTKTSKLNQYRVSVFILLSGIIFLLGIAAMGLILNNVESLQFEQNAKRISTRKLEAPNNEFAYLVAKLDSVKTLEDLPFDIEQDPTEAECLKLSSVELTSMTQIISSEPDESMEGKRYLAQATITCITESETVSFAASGFFDVTEDGGRFSYTKLADVTADEKTGEILPISDPAQEQTETPQPETEQPE